MVKELLLSSRMRVWLAIVGASTLVLGTTYTMLQQSTRLSADDLPRQIAQVTKYQLESDTKPDKLLSLLPAAKTDLKSDSTVFLTITDKNHRLLASSATLGGRPSLPPEGTFDYTAAHGSDRFTWQPEPGVRQAVQMLSYANGFIITGQSLKPYEERVNTYGLLAVTGWLALAIWAFVLILLPGKKPTKI